MSIEAITPSSFSIQNFGDGKTIKLQWSTVDLTLVKYFVLEKYDRHSRSWKPYDGFHGIIDPWSVARSNVPIQSLTIEVPETGDHSFRVCSMSKDGNQTEWITSSVTIEAFTDEDNVAESNKSWVREGLKVEHVVDFDFIVTPGIAFINGFRIVLSRNFEFSIPNEYNKEYLVYVKENGIIEFSTDTNTPENSLRLAQIIIGPDGDITVIDQRFLWAPKNILVTSDPSIEKVHALITWDEVEEINTNQYRLYRAESIDKPIDPSAYRQLISFDKGTTAYEDSFNLKPNTVYWYQMSTIDHGGNESPRSQPVEFEFTAGMERPDPPENLRGIIRGEPPRGAYRELQWDPVDHPHLTHYKVWIFDANFDKFVYLGRTISEETLYSDLQNLTVGVTRRYKVSAVASYMGITLESELSEEVAITIGTKSPPLPPEWDPVEPIRTSGTEESVSLFLNWEPVIQREDGSSVDSLFQYEVWSLIGGEFRRISAVSPEETETTIIYNKYARGSNVSIALKAVDLWGNSSELSEVRSIILGGAPPMPPEFDLENLNADGVDRVRISINKVNKDVNGEDTSVVKYKIYRSQFHIPSMVVHTLVDENPSDDSIESLEWIDSGVIRHRKYYYTVVAVDDNGNESERPDVKSIEIGDNVPPQSPEVIEYGSRVEGKTIINWIKFKMPTDEDLKSVLVFMGLSPDHLSDISNIPKSFADEDGIYTFEHSYGLENGVEYFYRLIGVDHSDNWTPKMMDEMFSIIAGDVTKPEAPVLLAEGKVKELDGELIPTISLTWNKVEEVTGYRIYKTQTNVPNSFALLAEIDNPDIVSYEDSHLPNGLKCWYYIVAYNKLGVLSERSEVVTAIAGDTVGPAAPNLSVESLIYNTNLVVDVRLVWDKDSDAVLYEVFRSDNNGMTYRQIGSVSEGLFVDKVDYPRSAKYYVVGYDALGNRGDRSVETLVQTERMTTPSSVFIDSIESAELPGGLYSAKIDWSSYELDEPEFFKSYRVYIGATNNPSSAAIIHQIIDPEIKNYTVADLVFLEEYYFGISVLDIFGKESDLTMFQFVPEDTTTPSAVRNLRGKGVELGVRIQWDPPKTNEDGTVIYDLAGYLIETSVDGEAFIELDRISSTTFLHHVSDDLPRYYRVSAYDNKPTPNFGEATVIGPFKAITLTRGLFDQTPPNHVSNITFPSYGIDTSSSDQTANVYVELMWDPVLDDDLDHYRIYVDGQYHGQSRTTGYKVNGLLGGRRYGIQVTAVDENQNESKLEDAIVHLTPEIEYDDLANPIPPPILGDVTQSARGLFVTWRAPVGFNHISEYTLECVENNGEEPDESDWFHVTNSKLTYFGHGRLSYNRKYRYRVRTDSTLGKSSEWAVFPGLYQPVKTSHEDIATGTVTADLVQVNSILTEHLSARSVTFEKLDVNAVRAQNIMAGSVQAEHLNVGIGSRNLVKNSAFGMRDKDSELLGLNWNVIDDSNQSLSDYLLLNQGNTEAFASIISREEDPSIPVSEYALRLYAVHYKQADVYQKLDIPTGTTKVALSFYTKFRYIHSDGPDTGFIVDLYDYDTDSSILDAEGKYQRFRFAGSSNGWERRSLVLDVSGNTDSAYLRISCNTYGEFYITAIKVEEGDLSTKWSPDPGESYGAGGQVQINQSGILVLNGQIKVKTNISSDESSHVLINNEGILAGKQDGSKYAKMTNEGFTSVGGMFRVTTAPSLNQADSPYSLEISSSGIKAFGVKSDQANVEIGTDGIIYIRDGSFNITTGSDETSGLSLTSSGITLRQGGNTTFSVNANTGRTEIRNNFIISSLASGNARFEMDHTSIRAYNSEGDLTFRVRGSDGDVAIGKGMTISTSGFHNGNPIESGERIVFRASANGSIGAGIYGYKSSSTGPLHDLGYELRNDGSAKFHGSIEISSENKGVLINNKGIYGPKDSEGNYVFKLVEGETHALVVRNAQISQGSVELNDMGIKVSGPNGIRVMDKDNVNIEIVKINNDGIQIFQGAGIKLIDDPQFPERSGSIVVGSQEKTAIDSSGIHADAITTGTLLITGSDENQAPKILVGNPQNPTVTIDSGGINVYSGALNVYDEDGTTVLIRDGKVQANAVEIKGGGSNLLRDGRADYSEDDNGVFKLSKYWKAIGNPTISRSKVISEKAPAVVPAGISGEYAFKIVANSGQQGIQQTPLKNHKSYDDPSEYPPMTSLHNGVVYTAVWNVYVHSGSVELKIEGAIDRFSSSPAPEIIVGSQATIPEHGVGKNIQVYQRFRKDASVERPSFKIQSRDGGAIFYVTDLMIIEGDIAGSFTGHSSELTSGDMVKIEDGQVKILSADGSLRLGSDGLLLDSNNVSFSLNREDGFNLDLKNRSVRINQDKGIFVAGKGSNLGKSVAIDEHGITATNGMFKLINTKDLGDGRQGYSVEISGDKIEMIDNLDSPQRKVIISPEEGLQVFGDKGLEVRSLIDVNEFQKYTKLNSRGLYYFEKLSGRDKLLLALGLMSEEDIPAIDRTIYLEDNNEESKIVMDHGLFIRDGGFYISNEEMPQEKKGNLQDITIDPRGMLLQETRIDKDGTEYLAGCRITADGIHFLRDGDIVYSMNQRVMMSTSPVKANSRVVFPIPFNEKPTVIIIPARIKTFQKNRHGSSQFLNLVTEQVTNTSFVPQAFLQTNAHMMSSMNGPAYPVSIPNNGSWEGITDAEATKIEVHIEWSARKGGLFRARENISFKVDFNYGNGWEEGSWIRKEGGGMLGSNNKGSDWISSKTINSPSLIGVRINVMKSEEHSDTYVKFNAVRYEASDYTTLDASDGEDLPEVHWIAVGV